MIAIYQIDLDAAVQKSGGFRSSVRCLMVFSLAGGSLRNV
jgi:hypothetical protein